LFEKFGTKYNEGANAHHSHHRPYLSSARKCAYFSRRLGHNTARFPGVVMAFGNFFSVLDPSSSTREEEQPDGEESEENLSVHLFDYETFVPWHRALDVFRKMMKKNRMSINTDQNIDHDSQHEFATGISTDQELRALCRLV
jgi:hypothetical protein